MKKCNCGKCDWEWQVDPSFLTSWIRCKSCNDSMFDKGIGVILINWDLTDINDINIVDVLRSNKYNDGVVVKDVEIELKIGTDRVLVNKVGVEPGVSLLEIQYIDEKKGIDAHGRLFANDEGKLDFEGNVTESARVFFEECLKPACENYIKELHKKEKEYITMKKTKLTERLLQKANWLKSVSLTSRSGCYEEAELLLEAVNRIQEYEKE